MAQSAGFTLALKALVSLSKSDQPITAKKIDAIIDPYLFSNGKLTDEDRKQLAAAFLEEATLSDRTNTIHRRIIAT